MTQPLLADAGYLVETVGKQCETFSKTCTHGPIQEQIPKHVTLSI